MYLRDKPIPSAPVTFDMQDEIAELMERLELQPRSGPDYSSDTMEEDFSTSMQLLEISIDFLRILRDVENKFGVMQTDKAQQLREHLEAAEEFTNHWE